MSSPLREPVDRSDTPYLEVLHRHRFNKWCRGSESNKDNIITHLKTIDGKATTSSQHRCKIGDWVQNTITETVGQTADLFSEEQFHHLHCDSY